MYILKFYFLNQVEAKVRDVYMKFERSCVWTLIESVMTEAWAPVPPAPAHAHAEPQLRTDAHIDTTVALFTPADAHLLVSETPDHLSINLLYIKCVNNHLLTSTR